jgi:3'-5' exoribonuclease
MMDALPGPLEWMGDAGPDWPPPSALIPGNPVVACYAVLDISVTRPSRNGIGTDLQLTDARGRVDAWLPDTLREDWLRPGVYVGVRGLIEAGVPRIHIEEIAPLRVTLDQLELFLPRTPRDADAMAAELADLIASVGDAPFRELLNRLLGYDTEIGRGFRLAPAATRNHHAYLGGLLEHTLSVARACDLLADHWGPRLDRDLLITGALLHDIGKVREIGAQAGFPYTTEGRLLGHILLGLKMVREQARQVPVDAQRTMLLEHLIAAHQGRYEWQSPREPRVLEALILHYVDDLDSKAQHAIDLIDGVDAGWTAYDRMLGREMLRHYQPEPEPEPGMLPVDLLSTGTKPARKRKKGGRTAAKKKAAGKKSRKRTTSKTTRRSRSGNTAQGEQTVGPPPRPQRTSASQPTFMADTLDMFE